MGQCRREIGVPVAAAAWSRCSPAAVRMLGMLGALLSAALLCAASSAALPDNRQWEMVSPPVKGGVLAPQSLEGAVIQASEDGGAITYGAEASGPVGEPQGNRSIAVTQFLSTRSSGGWATQDIVTPHNKAEGITSGLTTEYKLFSPDLSLSIVEPEVHLHENHAPLEEPPLSPPLQPGERQEKTIYLRADSAAQPGSGRPTDLRRSGREPALPRSRLHRADHAGERQQPKNRSAKASNSSTRPRISTTSCSNPRRRSRRKPRGSRACTSGARTRPAMRSRSSAWPRTAAAKKCRPSRPSSAASKVPRAVLRTPRHAISPDGARVVFTSAFVSKAEEENPGALLFLREAEKAETVQINAAQEGAKEPPENKAANGEIVQARFQTASTDDSKVFFTDTWPLTPNSHLKPKEAKHPAELFEFDATTRKLIDLTVPAAENEWAEVLGDPGRERRRLARVLRRQRSARAGRDGKGTCGSEKTELSAKSLQPLRLPARGERPAEARETKSDQRRLSALDGADWGVPTPRSESHSGTERPHVHHLARLPGQRRIPRLHVPAEAHAAMTAKQTARRTTTKTQSRTPRRGGVPVQGGERHREGQARCARRATATANRRTACSTPNTPAKAQGPARRPSRRCGRTAGSPARSRLDRARRTSLDLPVALPLRKWTTVLQQRRHARAPGRKPQGGRLRVRAEGIGELRTKQRLRLAGLLRRRSADTRESAFLDASASGSDVFFLTSEQLSPTGHRQRLRRVRRAHLRHGRKRSVPASGHAGGAPMPGRRLQAARVAASLLRRRGNSDGLRTRQQADHRRATEQNGRSRRNRRRGRKSSPKR